MLPRWIGLFVIAIILFLLAGMGIVLRQRMRVDADMLRCQNHLREISIFAGRFSQENPAQPALTNEIPAGTIANRALPTEDRLSWFVTALPWLDQKRLPMADLASRVERSQPWNSKENTDVSRLKLPMLLCPGLPPMVAANQPAPTSYFGTAGLGIEAAKLTIRRVDLRLGNFGSWQPWQVPEGAGCFRYEMPTPFVVIADGLSQTIMIGEREPSPGPWLQGGPSTVRGYDIAPDAPPPVGTGGQFGGGHPAVANFAFADGHVAPISVHIDPQLLRLQLTIADGVVVRDE